MSEKKVLIIDDDINMANAIERTLKNGGFETYTVNSGLEAGVMLEHIKPDVMTLDLKMPHMDGTELLSVLDQVPDINNIKVLVISGQPKAELELLLSQGANDILEKPFENVQLIEKINNLLIN